MSKPDQFSSSLREWRLFLTLGMILWGAPAVAQLLSPDVEANARAVLPKLDNPDLEQKLADAVFYTERVMPRAYQFEGTIHSPDYNISGEASEAAKGHGYGGNGNIEFPWDDPGGLHRSVESVRELDEGDYYAYRFLILPRDEAGNRLPMAWYHRHLRGDEAVGYSWVYPVGTIFGEVLTIVSPDDYTYAFEVRTRERLYDTWVPTAYRPFPQAADLANRVKELRPDWQSNPKLVRLIAACESPVESEVRTLQDRHPRQAFVRRAHVESLPEIGDDRLVEDLLRKTVFQNADGTPWKGVVGDGATLHEVSSPTTQAKFHIIPRNYDAAFIPVTQASCAKCHSDVNASVDRFDFPRDWYGRIRGSDQIFSFHPFDPSCISHNGFRQPAVIRQSLVNAGIVAQFDPDKHPHHLYARISDE